MFDVYIYIKINIIIIKKHKKLLLIMLDNLFQLKSTKQTTNDSLKVKSFFSYILTEPVIFKMY